MGGSVLEYVSIHINTYLVLLTNPYCVLLAQLLRTWYFGFLGYHPVNTGGYYIVLGGRGRGYCSNINVAAKP